MSGNFKPLPGTQLNLDHPLAYGLVGCWLMNEGSGGNVHDYSGQGNEGTISGMNDPPIATSGWNAGPHGGALAFDGVNDYVSGLFNIHDVLPSAESFSIVSWLYPTVANLGKTFIGAPGSPRFYIRQGTNPTFALGNAFNAMTGMYFTVENQMCAFIYDAPASKLKAYRNSMLLSNINYVGDGITPSLTLNIGSNSTTEFFAGSISLISIYNRALSAEEIAYLYAFPYCMFEQPTDDWRQFIVPYIPVRDLDRIIAAETVRSINSGRSKGASVPTRIRGV